MRVRISTRSQPPTTRVAALWAAIATAFVFRTTEDESASRRGCAGTPHSTSAISFSVAGAGVVLRGAGGDCLRRTTEPTAVATRRGQPGEYGIVGSLPLAPIKALCTRPGTSTGYIALVLLHLV